MTMTSWPYVAQDTTDIEYGRLFREMAASDGMVGSYGDNALKVTGDGSGRQVKMATGSAILRGYMFYSTAIETIAIAAPSAGVRMDLVVLELNLSAPTIAQRILPKVLAGTSGSTNPPGVTQTETGIYQIPLATVRVDPGVSVITADKVADVRDWMDQKYGIWTTSRRPASPRRNKLGFNETLGAWEYWSGSAWKTLMSVNLASSDVSGILPVANGGTGGATTAAARSSLSVYSKAEADALLADKASNAALSAGLNSKANASHSHSASDITSGTLSVARGGTGGASTAAARTSLDVYSKAEADALLADKASSSQLTNGLAGKSDVGHNHSAGDIVSGTLSVARGGTGVTSLTALLNALGIYVQTAQPAYAANRVWIKVP